MDENVPLVRSLPHERNSNHMANMKKEQISSEYQPYQADRFQTATIIDTNSKSNNHISSSTETNQSKVIEVLSISSHQSECKTKPNDTFDASESGPSSSTINDMTNLNSVSSNHDAENECSSDGDTNENDPIKISQSRHVRDELDLFCYVCNYGFKSFPRLIRHMETKKHANQVEKYHAMNNNSRHCFSAGSVAVPMVGCDQYRHGYQHRSAPPHLMPPSLRMHPQQQMLYQQPVHPFHHPPHHHQQLYHYQQTAVTAKMGHNEMELLPEDVINQMINSLGEDIHGHSDAFSEFETTDLNEMLEYLQ